MTSERARSGAYRIVDFHCHYTSSERPPLALLGANASSEQEALAKRLSNLDGLVEESRRLEVDTRVLSAPPALLSGTGKPVPITTIREVNNHLAACVASHEGTLLGLATIDAFSGNEGRDEVRRAVEELGFTGIVIDCSRDGLLLDAKEARPALVMAASLEIPVFAHPISPSPLTEELVAKLGRAGTMLARGTASAASTLALVTNHVFEEVAGLHIVFAFLGAAGLSLAAMLDEADPIRSGTPSSKRWHLYIDTMGFDPSGVRYGVDLLGADHVLVGSDWPIGAHFASHERVTGSLSLAGLSASDQEMIAGGNALRLLRARSS